MTAEKEKRIIVKKRKEIVSNEEEVSKFELRYYFFQSIFILVSIFIGFIVFCVGIVSIINTFI